jgi:hypothetical protein
MKRAVVGLLMLVGIVWTGAAAEAQVLFRWTDAQGHVHVTDEVTSIPSDRMGSVGYMMETQLARLQPAAARARVQRTAWANDVAECRTQARTLDSHFDAHIPEFGKVKMFGLPEARYAFSKCLDSRGHDMVRSY